jgi:hypothetical protein
MVESEGIARNIFNIVEGAYYVGKDATVLPEPLARKGQYALVYGGDKEILDTGWSTGNAWAGWHQLSCRWFSDIDEGDHGLWIEYWKRDADGNETLAAYHPATYDPYVSDEFGTGVGLKYFTENCEFRIRLLSDGSVPEDKYVAVDYLRIIPVDNWAAKSAYAYAGTDEGSMTVLNLFPEIYTVTGDGSSSYYSLTVDVPWSGDVLWVVPVPAILGSRNYGVVVTDIATDYTTFTIQVYHRSGTTWSGAVNVLCHLDYFPIINKL